YDVARLDGRAVDQVRTVDDADAGAGEIELAVCVDAGQLGRLAADERDARLAADSGCAVDELRDLVEVDRVRGDVVEQHDRLGSARRNVVDAVRRKIGAAVAQPSTRARDYELGADAVGRGREQALAVEWVKRGERAEPARASRLDGRTQPVDDRAGGLQRNSCACVAVLRAQGLSVETRAARRSFEPLAVQLRPTLGPARQEPHERAADVD